jgi:hypothetical protein
MDGFGLPIALGDRNVPQLHERCDLICPDLPNVL